MKLIASIFFFLTFAGCGTHSGNPDLTSGTNGALVASGVVVEDVCAIAERCRGVKRAKCETDTRKLVGFPDAMGAPYGKYRTVEELVTGLERKEVFVNESALELCKTELKRLSCASETVGNAFGPAGSTDLSEIDKLLRVNTLCEQLIGVP